MWRRRDPFAWSPHVSLAAPIPIHSDFLVKLPGQIKACCLFYITLHCAEDVYHLHVIFLLLVAHCKTCSSLFNIDTLDLYIIDADQK